MAKINLLPWREELREQRNKEYYAVLGLTAAVAFLLVYLVSGYYQGRLDNQNARNNYITQEMKVLDAKISEIRDLQDTREELIERMELIQALQGNRPVIVRVFDEVARSIPDDLFFTELSVKGESVIVGGLAKSNNRVAALMRNFDQSEWFTDPVLISVRATQKGTNEFKVSMKRVNPRQESEEK